MTDKLKSSSTETVGKHAYQRLLNADPKQSAKDTQQEADKEYMSELETCIRDFKNKSGEKEFFVVVIAKKERLMPNVVRRYFLARKTLPTPDYDQTVWHYKGDELIFVWVTPDINTCHKIYENPSCVKADEEWLKHLVIQFMEGTLYHSACKQFNIQER